MISARGMVEILYHNVIADKNISLDQWISETDSVTKDEIMKVAAKIELDTIYFLTEGGQQ